MSIKLICAISKNNVIGNENKLPWSIPEDLKRFKELTSNNWIVMGRKTFDSIGRPLPNRTNIVLSENKNLKIVVLNNNVVNKNLMPDITGKNVETIIEPSNQDFNNFFDINKNVIVLIPRDFENISVKTAENRMVSQQIIGIDQVRNPEINRIEAELRRAERDYIIAERLD